MCHLLVTVLKLHPVRSALESFFKNMKIDFTKLTAIQGKDPHRYPKVGEVIDKGAMDLFKLKNNKMIVDITKEMAEILKNR